MPPAEGDTGGKRAAAGCAGRAELRSAPAQRCASQAALSFWCSSTLRSPRLAKLGEIVGVDLELFGGALRVGLERLQAQRCTKVQALRQAGQPLGGSVGDGRAAGQGRWDGARSPNTREALPKQRGPCP